MNIFIKSYVLQSIQRKTNIWLCIKHCMDSLKSM